jgi:DNA polymerase-3 subunit beta
VFTVGDTEIHTRPIAGEYPNIEKIVPTRHNTRAMIDKTSLLHAVKSASIFARDNANILRLHIENQTIIVSANTPQVGENHVEVEAKVDGEGGDIAFNSRFLLEFLNGFAGEELLFEMTGSLNSGVFKPVKDDSYLHIIMPVRVAA